MNEHAALVRELPLAQPLERRRLQCYLALLLGDCAMLFGGYIAAGALYLGADGAGKAAVLAQLVLPLFLTIALYNGAYSIDALIRPRRGILRALVAYALSAALVVAIAYYAKSSAAFSRVVFTGGFVLTVLGIVWMRAQMRTFVRWRCGPRVLNELVILDGGPDLELPDAVHIEAANYGIEPALDNPVALDRIGLLLQAVDRVVVSCPPPRRAVWSIILKGANVDGEVIDDAVAELGAHGARIAGGHGFLRVSRGPLGLRARAAKRLFDVAVAGTAVIILAPLLAVVALAILLQDGAPVLFRQRRVGRGNRFFDVYKFRSMRTAESDHDGKRSTGRDDDRITPVGQFIRRTSIDELPQLFNVLIGEMSTRARDGAADSTATGRLRSDPAKLPAGRRRCLPIDPGAQYRGAGAPADPRRRPSGHRHLRRTGTVIGQVPRGQSRLSAIATDRGNARSRPDAERTARRDRAPSFEALPAQSASDSSGDGKRPVELCDRRSGCGARRLRRGSIDDPACSNCTRQEPDDHRQTR